ncbi:hypothetical protein [Paraburkholderia sp. BL6669N2]|uniref:hypothetical protein n=1 Tax=Paraburkholderia sp. BL6669N2 TaxID=1938807 RepID=UPI0011C01B3F|nr:hypothetical protein [Paraburkholderia sp. BL6669N2]
MGAKSGLADIDTSRPRAIPAQQRKLGKNRANAGNIAEEKEKSPFPERAFCPGFNGRIMASEQTRRRMD